jgi:RNA polymerase sigma factor (sigma-70 family)
VRSDRQLVANALAGDPEAFAHLVERNRLHVEAVARRMVGEEAEDLVQEALLRAYLGLSQLRDPDRFGAWLCGIALNLAKMQIRRRRSETRLLAVVADGHAEERELLELVRDAVADLPQGSRDAVLMHYFDGLSCDEIAALLGSSPGAIRVRLHRARRQLRRQLAPVTNVPTAKEEIPMIEMRLEDVFVRVATDDAMKLVSDMRVVVLREADGGRLLPIWIGAPEGNSLALRLTAEQTPRPVTSDVMTELVRVTGARIERVAITELAEKTFYAVIGVAVDGQTHDVDARPSDALNLAVRVGAPIFVADSVIDQCALSEDDVESALEAEAERGSEELVPGRYRSLSSELLKSLYSWR